MKISMVAFTENGVLLENTIQLFLQKHGHDISAYAIARYAEPYDMIPLQTGIREWTKELFFTTDAFVFIGAAGIAVRAIASLIRSKDTDPAVLVVDEAGQFVIPLLSGHIGGANRLALLLADELKAHAVLTTASDVRGVFAVDSWAAEQNMAIPNVSQIKHVTAALLDGKDVGLCSGFSLNGALPKGFVLTDDATHNKYPIGVSISLRKDSLPFDETLQLVPKILFVGIGCRRGTSYQSLRDALDDVLNEFELFSDAVCGIASIDLKADEDGIIELARALEVPFVTYPAEELNAVKGDFSASAFVKQTTGTDNVCERAAVKAAGNGFLIIRKQAKGGITIAIAQTQWRAIF